MGGLQFCSDMGLPNVADVDQLTELFVRFGEWSKFGFIEEVVGAELELLRDEDKLARHGRTGGNMADGEGGGV